FAEYGVTVELYEHTENSFGWGTTDIAEGESYEAAIDAIMTELGLRVTGPWTFTLDVPGA
ncbi:MAG: hypothetical protein HY866_20885, partial [Chloroflexi bacterium]|nr:hypothetical protein [Chloroflexota bacterium]